MGGGNLSKSVFLRELVAKHHRPGGMPGNLSYLALGSWMDQGLGWEG